LSDAQKNIWGRLVLTARPRWW